MPLPAQIDTPYHGDRRVVDVSKLEFRCAVCARSWLRNGETEFGRCATVLAARRPHALTRPPAAPPMVSMTQQWEVQTATGRCAGSGRDLSEGEEFYTVLFPEGDSFRRADYSAQEWTEPPDGAFCHFKSRVPVKEAKKKLLINDELLLGFFQRLAGETVPIRVQFRFVLALILMRKRLLKYESSGVESGVEVWEMMLRRDHSPHRVVNPNLTDDEVETVSRELSVILHDDMGAWADQQDEPRDEPTGAPATAPTNEAAPEPAPDASPSAGEQ